MGSCQRGTGRSVKRSSPKVKIVFGHGAMPRSGMCGQVWPVSVPRDMFHTGCLQVTSRQP